MKRTWRKKIGAVVALLAAVAVLGTGCGTPETTKRSPHMQEAYRLGKSI